jgi:diguanylate cyclase (GGDEF)-like protein
VRKVLASFAWFLAAAGAVLPWFPALSTDARTATVTVAGSVLVLGCAAALFFHRVQGSIVGAVVVTAGAAAAGASLVIDTPGTDGGRVVRDSLLLAAHAALCVTLFAITRRRLRTDGRAVLVDGAVVGLGSWVVLWVVLLRPALSGVHGLPAVTTLRGITLTLLAVALFLLATVVFSDAQPTPAVWLASAAVVLVLAGEILYVVDARETVTIEPHLLLAPFLASATIAGASLLHPSSRVLMSPARRRAAPPLMTRLVTVTASMVVPVILLSATDPASANDRMVRTVSVVVLATAVMARVVQAVRANARTQADLVRNAETDQLTGLPNRNAMLGLIEEATEDAWGTSRQPTVLFIDVDRFKNINDSLGHGAGDDVLLAVARRLRNTIPERAHVGRISGDEFVVLDPASRTTGDAMQLAERVLAAFHEPLQVSQGDVFVSASIGVALGSPTGSLTAEELLRNADTAMYRAKDAGRNCIAIFDDSMLERVTQRLSLETALYRALERRELRLVHQPIIDIQLGDVIGFEALMRWEQEDGTTVSPAEFIPIAEETGTIVPIGAWALLEALSHLRDWIDRGVCPESASMSVNVSPRQLHDPNFTSAVNEALTRSRIRPQQLWLEVTEGVMIAEPDQALSTLRRLNALGVRVAIDDFGTGYSSLSLLQRFPIQRLKIDRAFISGIADDVSARSLVKTIIAMADALGLDTVAEGVESIRQLQSLADLRCAKAQGFLISHPVHPDAMESTLAALERFTNWPKLR